MLRRLLVGLSAALLVAAVAAPAAASDHKVQVCHRTLSTETPWVVVSVGIPSTDGRGHQRDANDPPGHNKPRPHESPFFNDALYDGPKLKGQDKFLTQEEYEEFCEEPDDPPGPGPG